MSHAVPISCILLQRHFSNPISWASQVHGSIDLEAIDFVSKIVYCLNPCCFVLRFKSDNPSSLQVKDLLPQSKMVWSIRIQVRVSWILRIFVPNLQQVWTLHLTIFDESKKFCDIFQQTLVVNRRLNETGELLRCVSLGQWYFVGWGWHQKLKLCSV